MSLLSVTGLRVQYGSKPHVLTAVDGVDLEIPSGGTLALVGESGCGKTSVARALVALAPVVDGRIELDGKDATSVKARTSAEYRRRIQIVFQDPYSSLNPRMTVRAALEQAVRTRGQAFSSGTPRHAEARRVLDLVGLPGTAIDKYPHEFSGGQRQRVAIARALAVAPEILIADEITSALDVSVQATILNLLRDLGRELNMSYLFISHDLAAVRLMSDQVAVMYLGRIVELAPTQELFSNPRHPYTRALIESIPTLQETTRRRAPLAGDLPDPFHPPQGCRFHTRCPVGPTRMAERTICVDVDPQAAAAADPHRAACHFAGAAAAAANGLATAT